MRIVFTLLCLALYIVVVVFPCALLGFNFSKWLMTPRCRYPRSHPTEFVFPAHEHQLYMQKLEKRRQFRQRFFRI